jgi:hypothetical protein
VGTASAVANPASKSIFRREIRSSRIGRNLPSQPHQTPRGNAKNRHLNLM